jgi:hypothetical protein
MPSNYGTVSRRFLETLEKFERSPILKATAAVSDAALVEQTGQAQGAAAAPPPSLPDELAQMSQDPNLTPAERATVMQAAERIQLLTAPVEPEAPDQQAQAQAQGQPQAPQQAAPQDQAQVGEPAPAGEKSAAETDPDYDFSDIVPAKTANGMFLNASTEEGVLGWLRERAGR